MSRRLRVFALIASALGVISAGAWAVAQGTPSPRAGLTAQQTKQAVEIAREGLAELRKKSEAAAKPEADRREYVVGIELLDSKTPESRAPAGEPKARPEPGAAGTEKTSKNGESDKPAPRSSTPARGPLALVTSYRYLDDITVFATVDLGARRIVNLEAAQHLRTALSDEEFAAAKAPARAQRRGQGALPEVWR